MHGERASVVEILLLLLRQQVVGHDRDHILCVAKKDQADIIFARLPPRGRRYCQLLQCDLRSRYVYTVHTYHDIAPPIGFPSCRWPCLAAERFKCHGPLADVQLLFSVDSDRSASATKQPEKTSNANSNRKRAHRLDRNATQNIG